MEFIHTGLAVSSEENADRFYIGVLELEKLEPKMIGRELVQALFGIDQELPVLQYRRGTVHFELFVSQGYRAPKGQLAHACLAVADLKAVLSKCRDAGVRIIRAEKPTGTVTFIADHDGNLFELKEV